MSERGVEVVPEVVDVFAADAQAQKPGTQVFLSGARGDAAVFALSPDYRVA